MLTCKCGETDKNKFHKNKSKKTGYQSACKKCFKLRSKKYYKNNKQHIKQKAIEWRKQNKEKYNKIAKKDEAKARQELKDRYIKRIIVATLNISTDQISQEMIDLKRTQIQLKRAIENG